MLPCGMLVMLSFSIFAILLIFMKIISKGMMDCVGEFIALIFGIVFCFTWTSLYCVTDRHVKLEYLDENGNSRAQDAGPSDPEAAIVAAGEARM